MPLVGVAMVRSVVVYEVMGENIDSRASAGFVEPV